MSVLADPVQADLAPRRTELGLLLLAGLVTSAAYVLASLGRSASLPVNLVPFLVVILGLLASAHYATRRLAPGANGVLLPLAGLLNGIGYVFVAGSTPIWPACRPSGRRWESVHSWPRLPWSAGSETSSAFGTSAPLPVLACC